MKNFEIIIALCLACLSFTIVNGQNTPIDNISAGPHIFAEMKNVKVTPEITGVEIKFDLYMSASAAYVNYVKPINQGGQGESFGLESVDFAFDLELGSYTNEYTYGTLFASRTGNQISKIQGLNNVKGNSPPGFDSKFKVSVFRDLNSDPLSVTPTMVGSVFMTLPFPSLSDPDANAKIVLRCFQTGSGTGLSGSKWNDFAGNTRNIVGSNAPSKALPVTLTSFNALKEGKNVSLTWITAEETNSDHFNVQRSGDGKNWETIQVVNAMVESKSDNTYHATDNRPLSGDNLYRLEMLDRDGSLAFSKIQHIRFEKSDDFIFPNPVTDILHLKGLNPESVSSVEISDGSGKLVLKTNGIKEEGLDVRILQPGLYHLKVKEQSVTKNFKFMVVK